ncbi:hypothetical protein J942_0370 [Acinetobacter baumannii 44362_9]|uniref:Uncharacterized protein n=1 Tax=Acinetobacter baumannii 99063 TaxID=1310630 RepID=A0A009TA15_ACIBA|nr:hypothetical protein AYP_002845 [Acinetobacter baumannii]EJG19810.1 hypothetical protein ACIN5189_A1711 [Acinetobacter baumannii OIFC189]EKA70931.1 hypothetical protein ACINWC692_3000 [Acinetobacter baumannii WC-692]EKK15235.1 hypothetical protein ACIN5162_2913 [Acinetobacter baumannii OIFC0162]EKL57878.1 hypothetical protein ACIN5110_0912 [Acinetobacter baumannii OIFC110]EKU53803.1 hypothetical protein ACINWC348_2881 [Acinetobacter baumannii WC-348]ETR57556.1 hypothetical protein V427_094
MAYVWLIKKYINQFLSDYDTHGNLILVLFKHTGFSCSFST